MNTYTLSDLLSDLGNEFIPRGTTLRDMQDSALDKPDAEFGLVVRLTGQVEAYDLTAGEEPLLVLSARVVE
jgi:hypothetical protein